MANSKDMEVALIAVLLVIMAVEVFILVPLLCRRIRRRGRLGYIRDLQQRGVKLLFSNRDDDIQSALELLARFGIGCMTPEVMARLAELTVSSTPTIAALSRRVLRDCADY